ncbi:unnamed protein product [Peniophora sp. CBMAI 1063]|nr:unnamed protein product [Peniophora sp. CBMAI 1063]
MSTSQPTKVFLTGATGYLGGAILQSLMQDPRMAVTVLVRNKDKADELKRLGVQTVLGSLDDTTLMESEGAKTDAILQNAAYDHLDGVNALLRGAKARFQRTSKQLIFVHTSEPGGWAKLDAMVQYTSEQRISDVDPDLDNLTNMSLPQIAVHKALIAADREGESTWPEEMHPIDEDPGYIRSYIVYPSVVYGALRGPLVVTGIAHPYSIAIPMAIKLSIQRGQGAQVGLSVNRWSGVHIDDMTKLYKVIFEHALAEDAPHGSEGHYIAEDGEFSFADAAKRYTSVLHAHGKSARAEPEAFTTAGIESNPMISFLGIDVRIKGDRARQLGWSPMLHIGEFFESVQEDTEAILEGKNPVFKNPIRQSDPPHASVL